MLRKGRAGAFISLWIIVRKDGNVQAGSGPTLALSDGDRVYVESSL